MTKPRKKHQRIEPWWLSDRTEVCPTCSQTYAYHTETRCVDCDGPQCPICVQTTTVLEFSCTECLNSEARESEVLK